MKKNNTKRLLAAFLAIAMVVSLMPTIVFAGDTLPYQGESALAANEPTSHGYRAEDLLTWDPATDPYADLLRAQVPLQERIDPLAATQATPSLDPAVQYLTLAGDYGNAFFGGTSYTNEFSEYVFNFWQYTDVYAPWHGQTTATTPIELWDAEGERNGTSNWEKRAFEFGMMNLPNAAYTNAAHKNGALSLGCIFLPRAYQSWRTLLLRDEEGNFPYGDKLIELAEYYGFDGWFVNLEGSDSPSGEAKVELQNFLKYLRDHGQYIQYYNAGGSIDTQVMDAGAADSFFKDYGWSTSGAKNETEKYGYGAVFGGFEAGGARWSGSGQGNYSKLWSNGQVVCSVATLGTDFVHAGLDEDCGSYLELRREKDEFQWMSAIRERMWFTGSSGNPTDSTAYANAEVGVKTNRMPGIASFITERSVVGGDTFVTNFNTGHGLQYNVNGVTSNTHEWANINIQDILPTWQFWFQTEGTELKAEYDYGTKYVKGTTWSADGNYNPGTFDFDLVDPYNGGSTLAVYGKLDAENFMHLYKTDLSVNENTVASMTYKKTSTDEATMKLAVVFTEDINTEDNTYTVTKIALTDGTATNGWTTATADLSAYAGKTIAVVGLAFEGEAENYQMHIGQLAITCGRELTPDAPTGLTIAKAYDTNEMVVSWDIADYETVKQYNVYAVIDGTEMYMGGIYDSTYYIKSLYNPTGEVTIKLTAVGADGTESEAATAAYDYSTAVSGVSVEAADGTLTVSFAPADTEKETTVSVYVPMTQETYTATAEAGATSVVVTVPAAGEADGKAYTMRIDNGGAVKTYDGELDDSFCEPYDGPMTAHKLTSPVKCADWYKMALSYTTESGSSASTEYIRGKKCHNELNNDWSKFQALPNDISALTVTLTDYKGNVSEPKSYVFLNGEPVDLDGAIDETYIPDPALLNIVRNQAGLSLEEALAFTGTLDCTNSQVEDLTGLTYITGLTGLKLDGSKVKKITSEMLPSGLTELSIVGCKDLVLVELEQFPDLVVDFTGCSGIENLYLHGTNMTEINIKDMSRLHKFDISDSQIATIKAAKSYPNAYRWQWQGAKLDLTETTKEGKLMAAMATFFDTTEIPEEIDDQESVLNELGSSYSAPSIDLGASALLSRVTWYNTYAQYSWGAGYGMEGGNVLISEDGVDYTVVATFSDQTGYNAEVELPAGTRARFVKFEITSGYGYIGTVRTWGYAVAPKGFTYNRQQPAIERDDIESVDVPDDGTYYQVLDLLEATYGTTRTVASGTKLVDLLSDEDITWLDRAYAEAAVTAPKGVKVAITGPNGEDYVAPVEGPSLGDLDDATNVALNAAIVGYSGQNSNERAEMAVDGIAATKWCIGGQSGWMVIDLGEPKVVGQWIVNHAGTMEDPVYNTADFSLQVLNTELMSEDEYLALENKSSVNSNGSYWKDIDTVVGNTEDITDREIMDENLAQAQVYRLNITKSIQGTRYAAIRVFEMKMYAYTGQLGASTKGLILASGEGVGTYQVTYTKSDKTIGETTVTVSHAYGEKTLAKEATCAELGENHTVCTNCGETIVEYLPMVPHTYTEEVTEPTCEGYGYTTHTCSVCGHTYVDTMVQPVGHTYEAVVTAPTCDAMGYTTHTCSVCGDSYIDTYVPATDHNYVGVVTTEPTCEHEGVMTFTCSECGKTYTQVMPKAEHTMTETVVEPTCLGFGYTEHTCSVCGYSYISEITQPTGHTYELVNVKEATCTEDGYTGDMVCHCGDVLELGTVIEALGHTWSEWEVTTEADCTHEGVETRTCSVCGCTETRAIPVDPDNCASSAYADVKPGAWYHEGVDYVVANGIMNGTSATTFAPNGSVTRAMIVTILYRMAGEPSVEGLECGFTDVAADTWYTNAVVWASNSGITSGTSATTFAPNANVTRQELVTFLYRYDGAEVPEVDYLAEFADADQVGVWFVDAMNWAVAEGIISGTEDNGVVTLNPKGGATRAQVATIIMRYETAE